MLSKPYRLIAVYSTPYINMEGRRFSLVDHVLSKAEIDEETYQLKRLHVLQSHGNALDVIEFLAKLGLLVNSVACDCGKQMSLVKYSSCRDGFRWSCCRSCSKTKSIRAGSFFGESKLPLMTVVIMLSTWASEAPMADTEWQEEVSQSTIIDWHNFIREVCKEWLLANPQKIGGLSNDLEAIDVEIGRIRWREGKWVFGGIERESGKCFLVPVEDRKADTLLPIIREWVYPATRIISDYLAAYNHISDSGDYIHATVSSLDPKVHTNHFKNMWMRAKKKLKRQNGTTSQLFDGYLFEFMWRARFPVRKRTFNNLVICIRFIYAV